MIIGTFLNGTGVHVSCWRMPEADLRAATTLAHYADLAQTAERGNLHFLFLADSLAIHYGAKLEVTKRMALLSHLEPLTLLAALSAVTKNIGLIGSATTTFNHPFHIARKFASLDHLSNGRAGWNLVTSQNQAEAFNFGLPAHMPHDERYDRADEMAEIIFGLWDSWDDDAFIGDKEAGIYFDPEKMHFLNHEGKHFSVKGPLNIPRPIQGRPIISQAGSSDVGMNLGARTADLIFTAKTELAGAKTFYDQIKQGIAEAGRSPDEVKVVVGIQAIVGRTDEEAAEKFQALESLVHPDIGVLILTQLLGNIDLSKYSVDGPLPPIPDTNAGKSRLQLLAGMAAAESLSIAELGRRAATARGHWTVHGSAKRIANLMQEWYEAKATDGFILIPATLPHALYDFVDMLIPELQRRGLFRTSYNGKTLRENLGAPRPVSRYSKVRERV